MVIIATPFRLSQDLGPSDGNVDQAGRIKEIRDLIKNYNSGANGALDALAKAILDGGRDYIFPMSDDGTFLAPDIFKDLSSDKISALIDQLIALAPKDKQEETGHQLELLKTLSAVISQAPSDKLSGVFTAQLKTLPPSAPNVSEPVDRDSLDFHAIVAIHILSKNISLATTASPTQLAHIFSNSVYKTTMSGYDFSLLNELLSAATKSSDKTLRKSIKNAADGVYRVLDGAMRHNQFGSIDLVKENFKNL